MDKSNKSFPHPNPCLSFWLQGTRSSPLLGHRTTHSLPTSADVLIIGSGLSGAATAYFLLTSANPPRSIVMLEAREACAGATGRNGGHCRPDCYREYTSYKTAFGKEQAFKILANEMDTLNLMQEVIEKEGIDCDFWRGLSYDVAMDQKCADAWLTTLQEYIADGAKVDGVVEWVSDEEKAKKITRCPSAHAAAIFPAGSLWPYKLVLGLLQICISRYGLNLQTTTRVRAVHSSDGAWLVETERGTIAGQKVVYATNAFTATLLPEFKDKITPFLGQCSAIVPTKPYSGDKILTHTYSFRWGPPRGDYDYMIQRPKDGTIILGGGRWKVPIEEMLGQTNDSMKFPAITAHLKDALSEYLEDWGQESIGEGLLCDWTGVMGYTPEAVPYVGELNDKPGAFINAGHSGHGMARIMTCSRGLAVLMRGESWDATGLPECFEPTPERLSRITKSGEQLWLETYSQGLGMLY
ncbi:FAD dependent oxidoreductase [Ramaria rubella]|nr:FAD dependent oxidoreductase [Ramaria rubella]